MIRTFLATELDEMCKKRPPSYREDLLAIAARRPDGVYELDTGSEVYLQLRNKYAAAQLPAEYSPHIRPAIKRATVAAAAQTQAKDRMKVVQWEEIYRKGRELVAVLGESSDFAFAYAEFLNLEKSGGCRSCSRKGHLQKLSAGLKKSILGTSPERRQQVKDQFPDTVYFELVPVAVKWEDIMK